MRTKKFSLSQVIIYCAAGIVLVLGLERIAWRAGYTQQFGRGLAGPRSPGGQRQAQAPGPAAEPARTTILNELIKTYGYGSYLEVGQGYREDNFDRVNCRIKIGIDPDRKLNAAYQMTSDEFFAINRDTFDLLFIDGLHHADQAERDIVNGLAVLNKGGTIVVHDCNPVSEAMQVVPRKQLSWTGDVWKAWARLRATRADLKMRVINADHGCGVIQRGRQELISLPLELTYETLDRDRQKILNLVDLGTFLEDLRNDSRSRGN